MNLFASVESLANNEQWNNVVSNSDWYNMNIEYVI